MREWCEKNPVDGKWSRKRTHDFAQYQHIQGTLDEHGENDQDWPMTEAEFLHWATDTKRLTSSGASNWWKELLVSCKKDYKGRDAHGALGAQRLWVPAAEFSQRKRARINQSHVVENSRPMRRLTEEDLDELKDFAASRTADESFLRGEPRRVAPRLSPQTPTGLPSALNPAASNSPAAEQNASPQKEKVVDLALEKPKLINKQKAELRGLEAALREAARKGMEQWAACKDSTSDPSLQALMPHLQFRLRCSAAVFEYKEVDFLKDVFFAKDQDSVEDLLKNNPEMLPVQEEHVQHLQSFSKLQDGIDKVVAAATTVAQMEEAKEAWGAKKLALKSLEKGVNQATKDAKSRKAQQEKEVQRKAQAEQRKKDREQVDAFKEQSDQRAKALLAGKKGGVSKKGYVACEFMFDKMSQSALPEGFSLQSFTEVEVGKLPNMSGPWVLKGAAAVAVDKWSSNAIVTKTTQAYAVKYKAFPDYLNRGRVSAAFEAKHGHENTVDMFSGMIPPAKNMEAFPASQTFQNTTWLAGYSPEMRFVGLQANGALTLKTMAMGQVLHVSLSSTDVVKGLTELGMLQPDSKFPDVDTFCSLLEDLDMDAFVKMHKAGVKLYVHKAIPGEVIGIPMGWFCFELAIDGAVLVAARQGFFIVDTSEEDLKQYKSMRDILIMCGKAGDKYNQIIDMLSEGSGQ